jgi:anti-anti-sigma regulatory factor
MLRITEKTEDRRVVRLRLDGTLSTESFDDLRKVCADYHTSDRRTVIIDMAGVSFMSAETARRLARMRTDSLRIVNCSPFIATLLDTASDPD